MIHLPLMTLPKWASIEHSFPPTLQTLIMGPDHAMIGLQSTNSYASVRRLISVNTTLVHIELGRIARIPSLKCLEWWYPTDQCKEGIREKLDVVLASPTLCRVRVLHDYDIGVLTRESVEQMEMDSRVEMVGRRRSARRPIGAGQGDAKAEWIGELYDEWLRS